jgi:membrane protease YdiL (CAAX protease family)
MYAALFLALPVMNFLPEDAANLPCSRALTLTILSVGVFLILHGTTYILFTSQFKVKFPKIFDILIAGLLGFFGGFLLLGFTSLIIFLTPLSTYTRISDDSVQYNISKAYWLFDGIHSIVSSPDNEITTEKVIKQLINKPQPDTQNKISQQAKPDKPTNADDARLKE